MSAPSKREVRFESYYQAARSRPDGFITARELVADTGISRAQIHEDLATRLDRRWSSSTRFEISADELFELLERQPHTAEEIRKAEKARLEANPLAVRAERGSGVAVAWPITGRAIQPRRVPWVE